MKLSHEIAELSAVVGEVYARLIAKRYHEVIFGELAYRGLGNDFVAVCPFHEHSSVPTLHIHGNSATWRCFAGCGSGTWIRYLQRRSGLTFWDALNRLSLAAQIDLQHYPHYERWKRETAQAEICEKVLGFAQDQLRSPAGTEVLKYLKSRKLSDQDISAMELGALPDAKALMSFLEQSNFDKELLFGSPRDGRPGAFSEAPLLGTNRVVIPFRDEIGRIFTLFSRITPATQPVTIEKYRPVSALTDERDILFNLWSTPATEELILVEGSFDASRAGLANILNVVAINGVDLRPAHFDTLRRREIKKVFLVPDTDKVAQEKAPATVDALVSAGFDVMLVTLPGEFKDVDSLLGDLGEVGAELFRSAIRSAMPGMRWRAQQLAKTHAQDKSALLRAGLEYAAKIPKTIFAVEFLTELLSLGAAEVRDVQHSLDALRAEKLPELLKAQYLTSAQQAGTAIREGRHADFEAFFEQCKDLQKKLS
ncbi:MAG: toprim domain-containing protein [Deltaproteobacteria bacterium]|nr:toprim domain-containing protein [Deltaproteobacteria bacterium]